jgi:hypothetical protein
VVHAQRQAGRATGKGLLDHAKVVQDLKAAWLQALAS